ncbi:MAG: energy-coupled thiamine transporter ThiT [Lachnospiraceae bacterium]|nr:energy-coupled thiamine transporter ThiT [Candidatus Colinaster equi]
MNQTTKQIVFSGTCVALATVIATCIKLPSLPFGGSITLFSMLLICLTGYWFGPVTGFCASVAFALMQYITGPYFVHPVQVILDYLCAFGALGTSGFFCKRKNGLTIGYIVSVMLRLFFACLSGIFFYTEYIHDPKADIYAILTGIIYNCSYILPEMIITLILINITPVKNMLNTLKQIVTSK